MEIPIQLQEIYFPFKLSKMIQATEAMNKNIKRFFFTDCVYTVNFVAVD